MADHAANVQDIFARHIPSRLKAKPDLVSKINAVYQFHVSGPDGGSWMVDCTKPGGEISSGQADGAKCTVACTGADLLSIVNGKLSAQLAFMSGKLKIQGDMGLAMKLQQILA